MAVLQEQMSKNVNPFAEAVKDDPTPAGTWIATIIDIKDQFGVTRPSYENPQVMEVVDLTTFLFGYRDQAGQPHRIASKTMRISGNEKSNLMGFLKQALGATPKYEAGLLRDEGRKALTVATSRGAAGGDGTPRSRRCAPSGWMDGVPGRPWSAGPVAQAPVAQAPVAQAPAAQAPHLWLPPARFPVAQTVDDEPLPFWLAPPGRRVTRGVFDLG